MTLTNNHLEQLTAVGLSPEKALELKVKDAYYRMQLEKQAQALDSFTYTTSNRHINQTPVPIDIPKYNLEEGAWDVPVSQLVDLWTVRFGSKWVKDEELDEFYKITTQRLRPLNKLESHYVNGHDVYRIVE